VSALTQADLASAKCAVDEHGTEELYLHGACHPSAGTRAHYDKKTGVLTVDCRQCRKFIVAIQVAP
jgi:hypothetical protein